MWPQHLPLGRPCIAMVFAAMAAGLRELCHKAWPEKDYPSLAPWLRGRFWSRFGPFRADFKL